MSAKIRALQAQKAAAIDAMRALQATLTGDKLDFTEAEAAQFDQHRAAAAAAQRSIDRETELATLEAGLAHSQPQQANAPNGGHSTATVGANGTVQVTDNVTLDPKRGFKSKGEFFRAVKVASQGGGGAQVDPRLKYQAAAPGSTVSNESSGADGAFAIPPEFSTDIWRQSVEQDGALLPMTDNTEITSNSMQFPKDELAPWDPAGIQAYWKGEASAGTASKIQLGIDLLRLKELMVLVPVTNELLDDASALGGYLQNAASERILWKANEAILFGKGGAQPLGCMNSNALIVVSKETGQAAATLVQPNISKMRSRLKVGELKNAVWIGNPDIVPALEGMTVGQIPIFLPPGTGLHAGFDGTLNGRPLTLSEHANGLGSQSDISLLSLKGYRTITKAGGIESATSMHLYFDANATAFRFIFRMDGQPIASQPIPAPAGKGSNTRSYFVTLGAR